MRISTSMMHSNAVRLMQEQQTALAKSQSEVASGKRVQSPADDPVAAARIVQLEQTKSQIEQYGSNISSAKTRLSLEETALSDVQDTLERVYELAVQANSSALGTSDLESIATELKSLRAELTDIANRKDSNGDYLFAGLQSGTEPFANSSSGSISYYGDQGTRSIQVSASQYIEDGHDGATVFMNIPSGNGTFVTGPASTNTGTGVIDGGSITNMQAWASDDYTISFTTASAWQITDSASNVVATGTYTDGAAITFNGAQITISGTPAAGDSFTVSPSTSQDVFTTLDNLISAVSQPQDTDVSKAQFQNSINAVLTQLAETEDHMLGVRTEIGSRLSTLENTESARGTYSDQVETNLSSLRDSDYTEAVSRYSQQYTALQAAQQSYSMLAKLSLFDYL